MRIPKYVRNFANNKQPVSYTHLDVYKRQDIYFDMLVSEVDELVEKTEDYEKRLAET